MSLREEIAATFADWCRRNGVVLDFVDDHHALADALLPLLTREIAREREARPDQAVRAFHEAFNVAFENSWGDQERRALRRNLIKEEYLEYVGAESDDDPAATLDALVDMVYVIVGAALEYGFDFAGAFAAVHAANMAKLGPDGKPIMRGDGKILKPDGWKPADLTPFIRARREEH